MSKRSGWRDPSLWLGTIVGLALIAWGVRAVYRDVYLDVEGVSGYAFVRFAGVSYGQGDHAGWDHCHLHVQVPAHVVAELPDAAHTAALLDGAREDMISLSGHTDTCGRYTRTWQLVRYDPDDPSNVRLAASHGFVIEAIAAGVGLLVLLGLVRLVRAGVRRLRHRAT